MRGLYVPTVVLAAAADWDVFGALAAGPATAGALAGKLGADPRAMTMLLDALAALELLEKREATYYVPANVAELLTEAGAHSVLPMVRHQANCLCRWVQLPQVVKGGGPAQLRASMRGETADQEAFIGAMHNVASPVVGRLVGELGRLEFRHLLDIGGASGSWTIAFLQAVPGATATIFDLPPVIPLARKRIAAAGLEGRVNFVAGDFNADALPAGADFAWFSAIAHQNSWRRRTGPFTARSSRR